MKKIALIICTILLIFAILPTFSSCGGVDTVKDDFGFKRPKDSWITECLLLPRKPISDEEIAELGDLYTENKDRYIRYEELWGESGENGLASEAAVSMNGQVDEDGDGWIVYLVYANAGIPDPADENGIEARFEANILYPDIMKLVERYCGDAARYYGNLYGGFVGGEWFVGSAENGEELSDDVLSAWENADPVKGALQGAVVVECPMSYFGEIPERSALYAEISLRGTGAANERIDDFDMFRFSPNETETTVEVSALSVRYLPWEAYQNGVYTDDALTAEPRFEGGAGCYAVLEMTMTARQDNSGAHRVNVLTRASDAQAMAINIEEAPTGSIGQAIVGSPDISGYSTSLYAYYGVPAKAGESKTIRMVIRVLPVLGGEYKLDFFAVGDDRTEMAGKSHVGEMVDTGEATFKYKLSDDKKSYVVTELLNKSAKTLVIPDALGDGLPVVAFDKKLFYDNRTVTHVVIGKNVGLPEGAFWGCLSLQSLTFNGTKREWEELEKHWNWTFGLHLKKVVCSDGTVDLK